MKDKEQTILPILLNKIENEKNEYFSKKEKNPQELESEILLKSEEFRTMDNKLESIKKNANLKEEISDNIWGEMNGQEILDDLNESASLLKDTAIEYFKKKLLFSFLKNNKEKINQTINEIKKKFGENIKITDENEPVIIKHLEHLNLLPKDFIEILNKKGLKVNTGNADVLDLIKNKKILNAAPRGWDKNNWEGVPGGYSGLEMTVYAGKGLHGSQSLALHEYGHGVGDILGIDFSDELISAHKRIYNKLGKYYKQGEAGNLAGRQELLAESFAEYSIISKKQFIKKYDEEWYNFIQGVIKNPKDSYMNINNI